MNFEFSSVPWTPECFADATGKEILQQWNLDSSLKFFKLKISGHLSNNASVAEYKELLHECIMHMSSSMDSFSGVADAPLNIDCKEVGLNVLSMDYFDKLYNADIISPSGGLRGCYEEIFHGISIGDKLRELMINEDSENAGVFTESEKSELIFQLFQMLVIGGAMSQPDDEVARYMDFTKKLYKSVLTVYRESSAGTEAEGEPVIRIAGKAFAVTNVAGLNMFPKAVAADHVANSLIFLIDNKKKHVLVIQKSFSSFW